MPQRFLRPGITNSERWNGVSFDSQSLFVRLLTLVDDFGRCDGRTAVISGNCFSVWNEINPKDRKNLLQVERMLQQLETVQLIDRYESQGKKVLQIAQWSERVRPGVKERWPTKQLQQDASELQQVDGKLQQNVRDLLPSSPLTIASKHTTRTSVPGELLQVSGFEREWSEFQNHRKRIRHPMTERAEELILDTLKTRPKESVKALQMAIKKGWRGFEWSWYDGNSFNGTGRKPKKELEII